MEIGRGGKDREGYEDQNQIKKRGKKEIEDKRERREKERDEKTKEKISDENN
jgi:hypothetical protein